MKNLKINLFFFIAVCGCLASCQKNQDEILVYFPQSLYIKQITKITAVRLFTKDKEITDTNTIASFIKNEANFNLQDQAIDANEQITFLNKSIAQLGNPKQAYDLNSDFATRKTEFLFYSQKQYPVNKQDLAYLLLKYKSTLDSTGVAPNTTYTTKNVWVANGNYNDLNLSALSYKIKQGSSVKMGTTYNQPVNIDANALAALQTTDTVALQYFIFNYKVK